LKRRSLFQFNIFQKAKVALATWLCVVAPCVLADSEQLQSVHLWIEQKYPAVDHVDSDEYLRQVAGSVFVKIVALFYYDAFSSFS
jgi:hypothetical protein